MGDHPVYERAVGFLLDTQTDKGTWGYYEYLRGAHGDYVDQRNYLHTTAVVLGALVEAFDGDWPR